MSWLSKAVKKAKKIIKPFKSQLLAGAATVIGGPAAGSAVAQMRSAYTSLKPVAQPTDFVFSSGNPIGAPAQMSILPALPSIGRGIVGALPAVVRGGAVLAGRSAARIGSAAASYCRKHPAWCQTVGGVAAIEAMIGRGELPMPKRRRGRGITATELRNFKRVARFTSKYCSPVRKAMKAPAMRRCKTC